MRIEIRGRDLPGRRCAPVPGSVHDNVHVGLQRRREVVQLHPGDASSVSWTIDVAVRDESGGGNEFGGPFVHGRTGDRFLYLSWGSVDPEHGFAMFRRAKVMLTSIDRAVLDEARRPGGGLVGQLGLLGADGGPRCAAVRPPAIEWTAQTAN